MKLQGGCQCGAIRYELTAPPSRVSICHCRDCQRSSGAPMVSWAVMPEAHLTLLQGSPLTYNSSGATFRQFCGRCGTGLFYRNQDYLPDLVDVQSITLDDPSALAPGAQVQTDEAPTWSTLIHTLEAHRRFPGME
jgi:hypothetical protein